jgi:hypothetical protein
MSKKSAELDKATAHGGQVWLPNGGKSKSEVLKDVGISTSAAKISDLRDAREAACQRCLAASREHYEAHIDLIALDAAIATLAGEPEAFRITPSGFSWVDPAEASSRYAWGYQPTTTNWHTDIQARRNAYIEENQK